MNRSVQSPPAWHPDEISFLEQEGALAPGINAIPLERVRERWIHRTLREVFLSPTGYVAKRYCHFPGRKDYRKVWQREHRALVRLRGLNVPQSAGFITVQHSANVTGILHVRSLLPGSGVQWRSNSDIERLADLLSSFHSRLVVTLDPQKENFIFTSLRDRDIGFIDFGRARVFHSRNPLMLFNIGKELAKLGIEGGLTEPQFAAFIGHYDKKTTYSRGQKAIISASMRYWQRRHNRRLKQTKNH
ncbi:hypothetical protein DIT71_15550 [Marinobacter vulgaris]|uniref:Uncharacterized protein n=2 Tax=Marinobacter vulgaris TaxID=1928331 RepID=A0A2V3ZH67_9GAMM|nr:hypothetical protein DIT71_15550 [Marinobacter vulgaris]